jgi:hypothetical protein
MIDDHGSKAIGVVLVAVVVVMVGRSDSFTGNVGDGGGGTDDRCGVRQRGQRKNQLRKERGKWT